MKLAVLALAVMLSGGCAAKQPIHPNAANKFDSLSYDSLTVAKSIIDSTRADLAANAFPPSISGNVKTALNDLIRAYDAAYPLYGQYHQAAYNGVATTAQSDALTNAISNLNTKTTALAVAKKGS
jgi:hypothetical protein